MVNCAPFIVKSQVLTQPFNMLGIILKIMLSAAGRVEIEFECTFKLQYCFVNNFVKSFVNGFANQLVIFWKNWVINCFSIWSMHLLVNPFDLFASIWLCMNNRFVSFGIFFKLINQSALYLCLCLFSINKALTFFNQSTSIMALTCFFSLLFSFFSFKQSQLKDFKNNLKVFLAN